MKIGVRLVVIISIVNLIGIGLLAGITLILSQREIGRLAGEQAQSIAREDGEKISKWFEEYIGATRTLAQIMEGYQDIPVEQRRDYFNMAMRQVLSANPRLLGVCMPTGRQWPWTAWTRPMPIRRETMRPGALYLYGA